VTPALLLLSVLPDLGPPEFHLNSPYTASFETLLKLAGSVTGAPSALNGASRTRDPNRHGHTRSHNGRIHRASNREPTRDRSR